MTSPGIYARAGPGSRLESGPVPREDRSCSPVKSRLPDRNVGKGVILMNVKTSLKAGGVLIGD